MSRAKTFDQNCIFHEISGRCLLLYRVNVFRRSVTGMPSLFFYPAHFVAVAA